MTGCLTAMILSISISRFGRLRKVAEPNLGYRC
jgi:hypothetical protein